MSQVPAWIRACRPEQWSKNMLCVFPLLFAMGDRQLQLPASSWFHVLVAFFSFGLISSSVYLINDIRDVEFDRRHPRKRFRPIAAGELSSVHALRLSAGLACAALLLSICAGWRLSVVLLLYVALQLLYTLWGKHMPLLDVVLLSAGFVLRALAGAVAIPVPASRWLLACTFFLALFLALCKRYHEKDNEAEVEGETRPSLEKLRLKHLAQALDLALLGTLACYLAYTLSPELLLKQTDRMILCTLPLVLAGLLRYRYLVRHRSQGDRPERQLFQDRWMLVISGMYFITVALLFLRG